MIVSLRPDLVLINPPSRERVYQTLAKDLSAIEPPVWAGLMATYARLQGLSVEILDSEALGHNPEETAREAVDRKAALVAVVVYGQQPSASTQIMPSARKVCMAIKAIAPSQKLLLLGGHVAALPERTLRDEVADFISGGEGLVTLVELTQALKAGETDFSKVSDLYYRDGGRVVHPLRRASLVDNLDENMPGIAWDLLPMNRFRAHNWHCMGNLNGESELDRIPYAAVYTSLGCPFHCTFCCIQAPFKSGEAAKGMKACVNSYRLWSPERVVQDLEHLATHYGVKNVKFADEMFVMNRSHVEDICNLILERGLDLNIWAYARLDTVQDQMLPKLKKAGFNWLAFGIESANDKVRDDVQKGFGQEDILPVLRKVRASGIRVIGNYIFGLPEDDCTTMRETLDLAKELNCEFANFYCAMAYPGSKLYEMAVKESWKLPDSWGGFSQHAVDTLPLPTRHLSGGEVLKFRDEAFTEYYTNLKYLQMVEATFGTETLKHIKDMTRHKLERTAY